MFSFIVHYKTYFQQNTIHQKVYNILSCHYIIAPLDSFMMGSITTSHSVRCRMGLLIMYTDTEMTDIIGRY